MTGVGPMVPATPAIVALVYPDREQAMSETVNDSGLVPVEYRCVVLLDPVAEKKGSVLLPDEHLERSQMAATRGMLVAIGGNAFEDWKGDTPQVGNRVVISKYAGNFRESDPKDRYRLVQDKDILAILSE